ncbi:hypothetical protein GCM10018785_27010 [Streptomyces longispororuber]|uniref:Uncharacterized protein n=1 Tax=Streptomyces longispororuber TaxID=68230 RepID=A0A918ZKI4_9ACTN|nr:hypothetical protein [Streptomyces longispororuber]GHE56312.1 hypothetical protein GCM10018785_27010 [Streptomyces longispororuber]
MQAIPLTLDGYLTDTPEPGDRDGTAVWRLTCSGGSEYLVDEAVIPCTTMEPEIVHALLSERQPGDLLRVTGQLTLPDRAGGVLRLHADTLEVLWEAPLLDTDTGEAGTAAATSAGAGAGAERDRAIAALAEALTGLTPDAASSPGQGIRIHITPIPSPGPGLEHCHSVDVPAALAHRLADYIDAMSCSPDSQRPGSALDPETVAELTALFEAIDLIDLTGTVLKATQPEHRTAAIRALDDMFGDIPSPSPEDTDP